MIASAVRPVLKPLKSFPLKSRVNCPDLYQKSDDEPDFDCEFLYASTDGIENESIIDPDPEDERLDEFNDNQWDADIYDPYLESTYY